MNARVIAALRELADAYEEATGDAAPEDRPSRPQVRPRRLRALAEPEFPRDEVAEARVRGQLERRGWRPSR